MRKEAVSMKSIMEMVAQINREDDALCFEAERRMKSAESEGFISSEKVYADLGINESDLDDIEVEIEQ